MTAVADNGVNVQALLDAREVLKGAPEADEKDRHYYKRND